MRSPHVLVFISALLSFGQGRALPSQSPAKTHYKGREIAVTMHYLGAPWLIRESREREEECSKLVEILGIRPGDVVCDLGCGNGFYTLKIAERVGEKGKVIAVDIQPQMLSLLELRAKKTKIANRIETILGTPADPKLPKNSIDLVFLVDVYHELSHPEETLRSIRESLRPGGRIVLVEFREEDPQVPIKPLHKMSKRQILREIVPNGFRLAEQFDALPWQHVMFFDRFADDAVTKQVRAGLRRATAGLAQLSVRGGFAGIYSPDLAKRFGESLREPAAGTEIWVQPPGTPSVGAALIRAFELTGENQFLTAARGAGRAIAWGQRKAGGWDHRADVNALLRSSQRPSRVAGNCTFDDNISQGALSFLIALDDVLEEPWLRDAIDLGIRHLTESQFANGAWPQWFPLRGGYRDYYTFNDNAINDCIRVARLAARRYENKACQAAALRGAEFILRAQGSKPQAGWAQQYTPDVAPAAARSFEPAAICSAVTVRNLRTLLDVHRDTGDARFLAPFESALAWLRASRLPDGSWARFYELTTNKPIYGDRDGKVHYRIDELSEERRNGYAWTGEFGVPGIERDYKKVVASPSPARTPARGIQRRARQLRTDELRERVRTALAALNDEGRWHRDGWIHIGDFVRYTNLLCDYLDARTPAAPRK